MVTRTLNFYKEQGIDVTYDPLANPSKEYVEYIDSKDSKGFRYLGRVYRRTQYKLMPRDPNITILPYLKTENKYLIGFELNHRQCQPDRRTGYVAIQHYSKLPPKGVSGVALQFAYDFLHAMFFKFCFNSCIMTWEDIYLHLNKKTSCGYPYSVLAYFLSKQDFFNLGRWRFILNNLEEIALTDPGFRVFWQVSQKFEMRPCEKLDREIQSIRVFLSAPVDFVCLQNKYCLDFNNRFMMAFRETFSKVGMTKYRRGWNDLYYSFGEFNKVLGIDGEKFDTTISHVFTDIVRDFRVECMDPSLDKNQVKKIMKFIYNNIQNSLLVLEHGDLVLKQVGNTSGQANTIIDNTMSSIIALSYFYYQRSLELKLDPSIGGLTELMRAIVIGDDVVVGIREIDLSFINFDVMEKCYTELGMKITRESGQHVSLEQCEFLSTRFFKMEDGFVLPYMNRNKMFSSLMIGDKEPDPRWVLLRVYAFRIECWADKPFILMLLNFEAYLLQKFSKKMTGSIFVGQFNQVVTFQDIMSTRLSDDELEYLYFGWESQGCRCYDELSGLASKLSALLN